VAAVRRFHFPKRWRLERSTSPNSAAVSDENNAGQGLNDPGLLFAASANHVTPMIVHIPSSTVVSIQGGKIKNQNVKSKTSKQNAGSVKRMEAQGDIRGDIPTDQRRLTQIQKDDTRISGTCLVSFRLADRERMSPHRIRGGVDEDVSSYPRNLRQAELA
jgi:hypothetical protein